MFRSCKNENVSAIRSERIKGEIMINLTVCIGSSCHVKGSRQVVSELQKIIEQKGLGDKIELNETFCMGKCQQGVCVTVDDEFYSVSPDNVESFFTNSVLPKVE